VGDMVNEQITQCKFPQFVAAYNAGQIIPFGPLSMSRQGISNAYSMTLPWREIRGVSIVYSLSANEQGRLPAPCRPTGQANGPATPAVWTLLGPLNARYRQNKVVLSAIHNQLFESLLLPRHMDRVKLSTASLMLDPPGMF
jgi:hypothetical protein